MLLPLPSRRYVKDDGDVRTFVETSGDCVVAVRDELYSGTVVHCNVFLQYVR